MLETVPTGCCKDIENGDQVQGAEFTIIWMGPPEFHTIVGSTQKGHSLSAPKNRQFNTKKRQFDTWKAFVNKLVSSTSENRHFNTKKRQFNNAVFSLNRRFLSVELTDVFTWRFFGVEPTFFQGWTDGSNVDLTHFTCWTDGF